MNLTSLLSRRLVIVTGKGGVGKTTVSLALALLAAEAGKKVLLAEIQSEGPVAHLLQHPPIGYEETEVLPNLWALNIQPEEAFREYVLLQIRLKSLYRMIFENRLVKNFIEGTPGLKDLMCIGKIYSLIDRYDLVIVDAPASGHSLALLEIASIVASAVRVGPLFTHSSAIEKLLRDKDQTALVGVTLPEELPITEIQEFNRWLGQRLSLSLSLIFLNQFHHAPFTEGEWREIESAAPRGAALRMSQAKKSRQYLRQLATEMQAPVIKIPFVYSTQFLLPEVEQIAQELERQR